MNETEGISNADVESVVKVSRMRKGQRLDQVFDFLRREMVGHELVFTPTHAKQLNEEVGISSAHAYVTLKRLANQGLIGRKFLGRGQGVLVTFPQSKNLKLQDPRKEELRSSGGMSVKDLRLAIQADILELEKQILRKKELLAEFDKYTLEGE